MPPGGIVFVLSPEDDFFSWHRTVAWKYVKGPIHNPPSRASTGAPVCNVNPAQVSTVHIIWHPTCSRSQPSPPFCTIYRWNAWTLAHSQCRCMYHFHSILSKAWSEMASCLKILSNPPIRLPLGPLSIAEMLM